MLCGCSEHSPVVFWMPQSQGNKQEREVAFPHLPGYVSCDWLVDGFPHVWPPRNLLTSVSPTHPIQTAPIQPGELKGRFPVVCAFVGGSLGCCHYQSLSPEDTGSRARGLQKPSPALHSQPPRPLPCSGILMSTASLAASLCVLLSGLTCKALEVVGLALSTTWGNFVGCLIVRECTHCVLLYFEAAAFFPQIHFIFQNCMGQKIFGYLLIGW